MAESPNSHSDGRVVGIAYRPADGNDMRMLTECTVLEKRGLELENRKHGKREVTLLAREAWTDTCRDVGAELFWHIRRANFMVAFIDLAACIGHAISIGTVRLWIHGETRPCQLMDDQHDGLKEALKPNCRGGVHGQVISGGIVHIGDVVRLDPNGSIDELTPSS